MLRVVMLSWEYPPRIVGGISPHVADLSPQLVKRGIEVHVVTKATPQAPDEEIEPSGVHVHRVHLAEEPKDFVHEIQLLNQATERWVRKLLEDWRPGGQPTIFHAHDWLSLDSARELKYEYQLPMIATVHATEHGRHGGIYTDISRTIHEQEYWLTYEAWRVIVCSEFMKGQVHSIFNCPVDKIDVIFNGVNREKFAFDWTEKERLEWRRKLARDDEKIVMYVGRFVREKGIQVLLNAASAILSEEPNTKFVIVGGGQRSQMESFIRWSGLEDKILFTGFMANRSLLNLYRSADVAVFPSLYEPFGIVALEGMAAGAAVVSSDAGGLQEVVLNDVTGTTSFAGDAGSLAWGVLRALGDPKRTDRLRSNATARLATDFDWEVIAEQTHRVYDRVWAEFLESYWADRTLWPVSPGADERAENLHVKAKAEQEQTSSRGIEGPTDKMSADDALPGPELDSDPDEEAVDL
jgi:glycosyltransferase involved in cell wall biosynthesis